MRKAGCPVHRATWLAAFHQYQQMKRAKPRAKRPGSAKGILKSTSWNLPTPSFPFNLLQPLQSQPDLDVTLLTTSLLAHVTSVHTQYTTCDLQHRKMCAFQATIIDFGPERVSAKMLLGRNSKAVGRSAWHLSWARIGGWETWQTPMGLVTPLAAWMVARSEKCKCVKYLCSVHHHWFRLVTSEAVKAKVWKIWDLPRTFQLNNSLPHQFIQRWFCIMCCFNYSNILQLPRHLQCAFAARHIVARNSRRHPHNWHSWIRTWMDAGPQSHDTFVWAICPLTKLQGSKRPNGRWRRSKHIGKRRRLNYLRLQSQRQPSYRPLPALTAFSLQYKDQVGGQPGCCAQWLHDTALLVSPTADFAQSKGL